MLQGYGIYKQTLDVTDVDSPYDFHTVAKADIQRIVLYGKVQFGIRFRKMMCYYSYVRHSPEYTIVDKKTIPNYQKKRYRDQIQGYHWGANWN